MSTDDEFDSDGLLTVDDYVSAFYSTKTKKQYECNENKVRHICTTLFGSEKYFTSNRKLQRPISWEHVSMLLMELLVAQHRENDVKSNEFYRAIGSGIKRLHSNHRIQLEEEVDEKLKKFLGGY